VADMKILELKLNQPWAILPTKLTEIQNIYLRHHLGEKIDIKGIEAAIGRPLNNRPQGYSVQDGVAVLPIEGVIAKKMNLFTQISGGVSTQILQTDIVAALNDPTAHSIILAIDSPGGQVDGTQAAADQVRAARGIKPIVSLIDGTGASAAYWIAAAADRVYITGDTTMVGSIGVVLKHLDNSKAEGTKGIKIMEITSGRYKRIASEHSPLNKEGRTSLQNVSDHIYSVFVDAVVRASGLAPPR
jgi:signal peptide peptidase SppA